MKNFMKSLLFQNKTVQTLGLQESADFLRHPGRRQSGGVQLGWCIM